eukprot:1221611-Pyramimonas_sp.AAC.1
MFPQLPFLIPPPPPHCNPFLFDVPEWFIILWFPLSTLPTPCAGHCMGASSWGREGIGVEADGRADGDDDSANPASNTCAHTPPCQYWPCPTARSPANAKRSKYRTSQLVLWLAAAALAAPRLSDSSRNVAATMGGPHFLARRTRCTHM